MSKNGQAVRQSLSFTLREYREHWRNVAFCVVCGERLIVRPAILVLDAYGKISAAHEYEVREKASYSTVLVDEMMQDITFAER